MCTALEQVCPGRNLGNSIPPLKIAPCSVILPCVLLETNEMPVAGTQEQHAVVMETRVRLTTPRR